MADCEKLSCPCRDFREGDEVVVRKERDRISTYLFSGASPSPTIEEVGHDIDGTARLTLVCRDSEGNFMIRGTVAAEFVTVTKRVKAQIN